jgi:hypothetical protein
MCRTAVLDAWPATLGNDYHPTHHLESTKELKKPDHAHTQSARHGSTKKARACGRQRDCLTD